MRTRRPLLALAVVALLGLVPTTVRLVRASTYQPVFADGGGGDAAASIYCTPGLIVLGLPAISAVPPSDNVYAPSQWAAWNVTIFYSTDTVTWTKQTSAIPYWYIGLVQGRLSLADTVQWWSTQTGGWTTTMPYWTTSAVGYYAAVMQVVWYLPDGSVATVSAQPPAYTLGVDGDWSDRAPYCAMY